MARQHVLMVEDGTVVCGECGERQEPDENANPKLNRPCEGFQYSNEPGAKMSKYKSGKEKFFNKYPMMRSYNTEEKAERARAILYGDGPFPPDWRLPQDDMEKTNED